jgi:hypothetical protein
MAHVARSSSAANSMLILTFIEPQLAALADVVPIGADIASAM